MRTKSVTLVPTVVAIAMVAAATWFVAGPAATRAPLSPTGRGGAAELQEQQEATDARLQAFADARAAGIAGRTGPITRVPVAGWAGERVMNGGTDDWEPAIAADPNAPFVYLLATRYGQPKPCQGNCPVPHTALEISSDGGRTWSTGRPLCACKGSGQFDPIIEVVADTGEVYALYMNGFNTVFLKSSDHGRTWSDPVPTYGKVSWTDKPILTTSADGKHIYVSWNGPTVGDMWVAQSHDRGETWTQTRVVQGPRYFFAYDGVVLSDGTVVLSEGSISYTGPAAAPEGKVFQHAFVSRDRGTTWENVIVDKVNVGEPCVAAGCGPDFYIGHSGVSADADDDLVYTYDGATENLGPQRIFVRRSTDGGRSWSARVAVSTPGENATAPAIEAVGNGDVRLWYYETSGHDPDAWNVWYRSSSDGGRTWSARALLSNATSGAGYKTADGFMEIYGDYGEIAVMSNGKTIAAWGEGFSWTGPGGVWVNRQV